MNLLAHLDKTLSLRLFLPVSSGWREPARFVAHLGDGPYVLGCLALVYLLAWWIGSFFLRQMVFMTVLITGVVAVVVTLVKFTVRRRRPHPPGEFVSFAYDAYSFPSGHSARLAALAVSAIFFFPDLSWPLVLIALLVAAARVAVGIHYLGDTLAGLGLGALVAWETIVFASSLFR